MNAVREITIRRCTLRVIRRGGWSWGADAQTLARRAIEQLPELLERRLAELAEELPEELDIAEPIRIRVVLHQQEWADLIGAGAPREHLQSRLDPIIEVAMLQALPANVLARVRDATGAADPRTSSAAAAAVAAPPIAGAAMDSSPSALRKLLARWRTDGALLERLAALGEDVLRLWRDRLFEPDRVRDRVASDDAAVGNLWNEVCALPLLIQAGPARTLARQIVFWLELEARGSFGGARTREWLAGICDDGPVATTEDSPAREPSIRVARSEGASVADGGWTWTGAPAVRDLDDSSQDAGFEVDIPCALPFLLLTPLMRSGYLVTVAAALEAAHATSLAAGVGLGLAHKCLAVPQRGWLREAGGLTAAAAFAGQRTCDNALILNAGRALQPQLSVLDTCVADQLVRGHRPEAGWLLARDASGALLLFDEDGIAPVATGPLAVLAVRIAPSGSIVFVPAGAVSVELFDALDELLIPYASDSALTSRASARSFIAPDGARLWTSTHGAQQGRARSLAERGAALCEAALDNWATLHEARPAQRPGVDPAFETSLSLAAGYALSAIAWTLWQERARATARTAIETFADFDARVRVTPERVHVTVPMGRRAWDLRDHGLLGDVRDVPWFGARTVTFGVG